MEKYSIKGYKTHEDCQYGHSDYLTLKTTPHKEHALNGMLTYRSCRYFQLMVVNENTKSIQYAYREGNLYSFVDSCALIDLCKQLTDKISKVALRLAGVEGNFHRFELCEDMGMVDLKIGGGKGLKVFSNILENKEFVSLLSEDLEGLIKAVTRLACKPVKKVCWCTAYDFNKCYFTDDKLEKGSVDLYFDWF